MKKHKGGHHGGAWKVAYADFVTAMMALFLVLWLTAQDAKIKDAVERAFRNPFSAVNKESTGIIPNHSKDDKDASNTQQHQSQGAFQSITAVEMAMLRKVTEDLERMLEQKEDAEETVLLELTPEGLRVNIFDRSHKPIFEPNSAEFTPYGNWVFSTLAWEIARYQSFKIELEGHTELKIQSDESAAGKWELSANRANSARRKLVQSGVTPKQIFKVSGFADTQPMARTAPDAEVNRRVTVQLKLRNPNSQLYGPQTAALGSTNELVIAQ